MKRCGLLFPINLLTIQIIGIKVFLHLSPRHPFCCFFLSHFLQSIHTVAHCKSSFRKLHCGLQQATPTHKAKKRYTPTATTVPLVPEKKQP